MITRIITKAEQQHAAGENINDYLTFSCRVATSAEGINETLVKLMTQSAIPNPQDYLQPHNGMESLSGRYSLLHVSDVKTATASGFNHKTQQCGLLMVQTACNLFTRLPVKLKISCKDAA